MRLNRLAAAGAAAAIAALAATGPAAAQGEKPPPGPPRAAPQNTDVSTMLISSLNQSLADSACFGGTTVTNDGIVQVRYVDTAPCQGIIRESTAVARGALGLDQAATALMPVTFSLANLQGRADTLTANVKALESQGAQLNGWGVHIADNVLYVGLDQLTPSTQRAVEALVGLAGVEFAQDPGYHQAADRVTDSPPWYGADRIVGPKTCTSGFTLIDNAGGLIRSSTAGHCGYGSWTQGGQSFGSTILIAYREGGYTDSQLITAPRGADGRIWTGGANVSKPVKSWYPEASQDGGQPICTSGGYSGTHCDAKILNTNQCHRFTDDNVTICHLIDAFESSATYGIQPGDSGGPVYSNSTDNTAAVARGMLAGIFGANPGVYSYTPITQVFTGLGAKLALG